MYGDPEVMRHRAGELREQATELRLLADRLVGQAEAVTWSGRAASAMRERIRDRAARLREIAVGHDDAAAALDRHRAEVERLIELIAVTQRRVTEAGRPDPLGSGPPGSGPPGSGPLPPSGHRDWLALAVPASPSRDEADDSDGGGGA